MKSSHPPSEPTFAQSNPAIRFKNSSLTMTAAFLAMIGLLACSSYFISLAADSNKDSGSQKHASALNTMTPVGESGGVAKVGSIETWNSAIFASLTQIFSTLLPVPQSPPDPIATYAPDCTTPKTDFNLGDTVCAKASGVPSTLFPWRVLWLDAVGFIRQSETASPNAETTYQYMLPSTRTSEIDGKTVDNVGTWRVNLTRSNGSVRASARLTVHDVAQPAADLFVQKFVRGGDSSVPTGGNLAFLLVVGNQGPDAALSVHLVDSIPSGSTLVSFTQELGPICTPEGSNDCTIASLANGERSEFTAIYNTGSSAPGSVTTSATISNQTPDPDNTNNTSTAEFSITSGGGGADCSLTCPTGVTTGANTTENGQRGAYVNYEEPLGTGTCGSISSTPASGSFFPVGTTTVNATSETGAGSCSFTVTIEETGGPSITCPANKTATADSNCQATVDPGQPTTSGANVTVTGSRSDERELNDPYPSGTTTITWTATNSGGSASCQQTITLTDSTPPTITAPTAQTASADASCQAEVPDFAASATTSDNCDAVDVSQEPASGSLVELGSHTVILTATDGSGNSSTATTTFTVNDTTAPIVTAPADSSADADASCQAPVPDYAAGSTASDNCGDPTVTQSPAAGTLVGSGSHTVTVTATDSAGNSSSDEVVFTANDTTPPIVTAPADSSASADASCQAPVPNYAAGSSASDNCGNPTVTQSPAAGTLVGTGPHTVIVTATDSGGNSSSDTVVFTVNDTTPPVISCPANIIQPTDPASCSATVNPGPATATDNCGTVTVNGSRSDGQPLNAPYPAGATTITWTATDSSGNQSSCTQSVTVNAPAVTSLGPANLWVGLKNSDSVGLRFDLLAEVYKNDTLIGSGQVNNVPGGSSGFNNAILRTIAIAQSQAASFCAGDQLKIKLWVRAGATGHVSGYARLWYNDAAANSRFDATIGSNTNAYYLLDGFITGTAAGPGPKKTIDVFVHRTQNGNAFKLFGAWVKAF